MFESLLVDPPFWILWGLGCLSVHILSYLLSSHVLPKGPWTELPSFTAHQVVALPVMIYTTILGFQSWFGTSLASECSENMALDIYPQGIYFGQLVIGGMLFWDIPTGFLSDGMGDPIMHVHHIGMFLVAGITVGVFTSQPIGSCYAPFFFGVIEVSSIPLAIVDIFHPKRKAWYDYHVSIRTLVTINDISRGLFAVLFILIRAMYFPYVVLLACFQKSGSTCVKTTYGKYMARIRMKRTAKRPREMSLIVTSVRMEIHLPCGPLWSYHYYSQLYNCTGVPWLFNKLSRHWVLVLWNCQMTRKTINHFILFSKLLLVWQYANQLALEDSTKENSSWVQPRTNLRVSRWTEKWIVHHSFENFEIKCIYSTPWHSLEWSRYIWF